MQKLKITIHLEVDDIKTNPDAEIIGIKEDFANYCEKFGDVREVEVETDEPTLKKVAVKDGAICGYSTYNCPTCGQFFGIKERMDLPYGHPASEYYKRKNFCYNCGQGLDWRNEE